MNEIQIIRKQLATERAHFAEVAQACSQLQTARGDFVTACTDYFAFAVTRFEAAPELVAQLASGLSPEFLAAFTEASCRHFEKLDAVLARNLPVTEWRAVSRIDADSIVAERVRYSRVKATIPT
jgi:hypothetical protein